MLEHLRALAEFIEEYTQWWERNYGGAQPQAGPGSNPPPNDPPPTPPGH